MSTEQDLLNRVLAAVGALDGVLAWRNNTGALRDANGRMVRFGARGSADVFVIAAGRFVGIECKHGRGRQSEDQKRWQRACEAAGGVYVLAYDVETARHAVIDAMRLLTSAQVIVRQSGEASTSMTGDALTSASSRAQSKYIDPWINREPPKGATSRWPNRTPSPRVFEQEVNGELVEDADPKGWDAW